MSDDERRCLIRGWCWTHWGKGPSVAEQTWLLARFVNDGADICLAEISDSPTAAAFRKRRGW